MDWNLENPGLRDYWPDGQSTVSKKKEEILTMQFLRRAFSEKLVVFGDTFIAYSFIWR